MNSNKKIAVYDNTVSAREYISYIAEQAGGFACIGRDGKLYIKAIGEDTAEVNIELFQEYSWGEQFKVSRVAYEDGIQDFKFGNETDNTIWINPDNMYIVDENQIENIYNQLNNFECCSFEGTTIIDPALDVGDIAVINGKKVIYQGDMEYVGKFKASVSSKIQAKQKEETTRTVISDKAKIRRVQSQINQVEGTITQLAQETGEYEEKLTQVEQSLDNIKQTVSNIADFTREQTSTNQIHIDDTVKGYKYILDFIIYGNTELFNSNEITIMVSTEPRGYGEAICITTENDEDILTEDGQQIIVGSRVFTVDYIKLTLDDMLRNLTVGEEIYYDTLEISRDGTITITRKIGVDNNGELYLLDEEIVTVLEDTFILPSEEEVYYFIEEIYGLKYYAKYITNNDFVDCFATKVELNSKITQTANEISSEVSKKVDETEIISKINQSAEEVSIQAKKISLEGYTTINKGFTIDENGNASIANETVKINENGIQMADGAKIVGGNGIYTNLQFFPQTSYDELGYQEIDGNIYQKYINIYADIPENFTIESAYISIIHQPISWTYLDYSTLNNTTVTGYSRNIQIYIDSLSGVRDVTYGSEYQEDTSMSGTNTKALGSSGKTFSSSKIETIKSSDLSQYLSSKELTIFSIGSTTNANTITTLKNAFARTGRAIVMLNVLGYLNLG